MALAVVVLPAAPASAAGSCASGCVLVQVDDGPVQTVATSAVSAQSDLHDVSFDTLSPNGTRSSVEVGGQVVGLRLRTLLLNLPDPVDPDTVTYADVVDDGGTSHSLDAGELRADGENGFTQLAPTFYVGFSRDDDQVGYIRPQRTPDNVNSAVAGDQNGDFVSRTDGSLTLQVHTQGRRLSPTIPEPTEGPDGTYTFAVDFGAGGPPKDPTYTWTFGDGGKPGSGPTPSHLYPDACRQYSVTVSVTGGGADEGSEGISPHLTVGHECLHPVIDPPPAGPHPTLSATIPDATGPVTYRWGLGDGSTSTHAEPELADTCPRTVTLTVTGTGVQAGETGTDERTVGSGTRPTCSGTPSPTTLTPVVHVAPQGGETYDFSVTFAGSATPEATYAWTFGPHGTGKGPVPEFTFDDACRHRAEVVVTGAGPDAGRSGSAYVDVGKADCGTDPGTSGSGDGTPTPPDDPSTPATDPSDPTPGTPGAPTPGTPSDPTTPTPGRGDQAPRPSGEDVVGVRLSSADVAAVLPVPSAAAQPSAAPTPDPASDPSRQVDPMVWGGLAIVLVLGAGAAGEGGAGRRLRDRLRPGRQDRSTS